MEFGVSNRKGSVMAKEKSNKKEIGLLAIILLIVIGAVAGFFTAKHITRNDVFEIIGEQTITVNIGESYQDEGARAISFGKDISSKIVSETNVNYSEEGTYYIKYSVDDIRYRGIERYRTIIVQPVASEVTDESV